MALKPCRECKKKVSTEANTCPNCGVPNPTTVVKIQKLKPDYGYARCEKSFCNSRYKLLELPKISIGTQICQACGNTLQNVTKEDAHKDIERLQSKSINYSDQKKISQVSSVRSQQNIVEKIWWGNETLSNTFWMYCILTQLVVGLISGLLFKVVGPIIIVIPAAVIIWTNTGLWRSSEKYKKLKIKSNEPYGWATAAKVYVVLTYIYCLSQLGLNLPK